jgi:hypothetical protein
MRWLSTAAKVLWITMAEFVRRAVRETLLRKATDLG